MSRRTGTGKYEQLLVRCESLAAIPTAVAHPCEESALLGAVEAGEKGLIEPILVGPAAKIREIAGKARIDISRLQVVDAPHSHAAAARAVAHGASTPNTPVAVATPLPPRNPSQAG